MMMNERLIAFDDLVQGVIDGEATPDDLLDMIRLMQDDPDLQKRYARQMHVHTLLSVHGHPEALPVLTRQNGTETLPSHITPRWQRPAIAAAAAILLLSGAVLAARLPAIRTLWQAGQSAQSQQPVQPELTGQPELPEVPLQPAQAKQTANPPHSTPATPVLEQPPLNTTLIQPTLPVGQCSVSSVQCPNGGTVPPEITNQKTGETEMSITNKTKAALAATLGAATLGLAVPTVSDVTMQQIENTRQVQITYKLSGESAIVTLAIETNGVSIGEEFVTRLSGDVNKVIAPDEVNTKAIIWQAGQDWPENVTTNAKAVVTAWSLDNPPQVMVVDLNKGTAATAENPYPITYYPSLNALPYGVTNTIYKDNSIVFRKIPNGSTTIGSGATASAITLTKDYYMGIYEVTQGQFHRIMGGSMWATHFTHDPTRRFRPMEKIAYYQIRENNYNPISPNWPNSSQVYSTSFMGRLRERSGYLNGFDLPTEAQWEYACRAGTSTFYGDGSGAAPHDGVSADGTVSNNFMKVLGRYKWNGGFMDGGVTSPPATTGPDHGTAIVGSYQPNAWGLYDMHGNVVEWMLDKWDWSDKSPAGTNPKGGSAANSPVIKGGGWVSNAGGCSAHQRNMYGPADASYNVLGFRLAYNIQPYLDE
jgi:formylglycine-generating enzyme required for sulfatase activity